ncbi:MAG: calcium-binding protein [Nocardioidaceae bacterium]
MIRAFASVCASLVLSLGLGVVPAHAQKLPPTMLGPGDAGVHDVKDKAIIRMSKFGLVYISGQQNGHLTITYNETANTLRYRDTGTKSFKSLAAGCKREKVTKGVSAVCKVPSRFDHKRMFLQVWPRLGNDFTDGRTLPARFRLWVLTDAGRDITYGGAGADFVNGAKGNDLSIGGRGNDWLRGGPGADKLVGGAGHDRIARN